MMDISVDLLQWSITFSDREDSDEESSNEESSDKRKF